MHHFFEAITNTSGESLIGYFARVINPATQGIVTLAADDSGTPVITVSGVADMAKTDDYGNLSFYVVPGTYHLDIYAADATTFVYRVSNVAMNSTKGDKGDQGDIGDTGLAANTFEGVDALKAANIALFKTATLIHDDTAPDGGFNWTPGNFTGQADDLNIVKADSTALTAGAWVRQKADGVSFQAKGALALNRSVTSKLEDVPISVMDFMTPAQVSDVRQRLGTLEVTAAINAAFAYAQAAGRTVFFPDGLYIVGNLIYGAQNTLGQSVAPLGLSGQSKTGTILKAKAGLTGTLLKSWSVSGATFRNFGIDTTGSTAVAWDGNWKVGAGPSTQCVVEHIIVSVHNNFTDGTVAHVSWNDMNDTYPIGVTVRAGGETDYSNCYLSAVGSGGLMVLRGCIWTGGWLNFGCQVGALLYCWGHGIKGADGCLNHVEVRAGYPYGNPTYGSVFWGTFRALTISGTEMNSVLAGVTSYFDIVLFSTLKIEGSEFIGSAVDLLGPNARGLGVGSALVMIEGGTHDGTLVPNDVPAGGVHGSGLNVTATGFINAATSLMVTKDITGTFTPIVAGGTAAGTGVTYNPATEGSFTYHGNLARGYVRLIWSGLTGATGQLEVRGISRGNNGKPAPITLSFNAGTFPAGVFGRVTGTTVKFYNGDGTDFAVPAAGNIEFSFDIEVAA